MDADTDYKLQVGLYGAMGENCENVGTEFNPLREINYYGQVNPYQDPTRGRFEKLTSNSEGVVDKMQDKLEQNMAGYESIIGLSLSLLTGELESEEVRGCCVIARDAAPAAPKQTQAVYPQLYPNSAYHPSRGHYGVTPSYGSYGGYASRQEQPNTNSYGGSGGYGGYGGQ